MQEWLEIIMDESSMGKFVQFVKHSVTFPTDLADVDDVTTQLATLVILGKDQEALKMLEAHPKISKAEAEDLVSRIGAAADAFHNLSGLRP